MQSVVLILSKGEKWKTVPPKWREFS